MGHKPASNIIQSEKRTPVTPSNSTLRQYPAVLSFAPLLRYWEQQSKTGSPQLKFLAKEVLAQAQQHPKLAQPITDTSLLAQHADLLELLLSPVFPQASNEEMIGKATAPCQQGAFYHTRDWRPAFEVALPLVDEQAELPFDHATLCLCVVIVKSCLKKQLDFELPTPPPISITDEKGFERYYRPVLNMDFVEVKMVGNLPKLGQPDMERLLKNIYDAEGLFEALPAENFEIQGFVATTFEDVTTETAISRINSLLLRKDAFKTKENIAQLENLLRSYFQFPGLRVGVLSLRSEKTVANWATDDYAFGLLNWKKGSLLADNPSSVYAKACRYAESVLSEQFAEGKEKDLVKQGIQSHLVIPLKNSRGQVIGLMELGADEPYAINSFTEIQLRKLLPQLSRCMEQQQEEIANRIEAVMRQKFTAIHHSVEWRFVEVAERYLAKMDAKGKANMEPIVFNDIYPLYAQADIVSSSLTRNRAIRADMQAQMKLIQQLLRLMVRRLDYPLLKQVLRQAEEYLDKLTDEMQSSDEPFFINFVLNEVHPLLREVSDRDVVTQRAAARYFKQLDPDLGIVYDQRKAYEQSLNLINEALSECVDEADERAQRMSPHFFEKYQTDGVQFELYVGQSLLRQGTFSEFQLNNLRLWQFQTMCEVTRQMRELKKSLPLPLDTAQLVFVYGQPISVRFRMDEKFFDVDGAYNLRYEIIKKRIDKACILGSEERLTVPGKIAVVFATEDMRKLYLDFCDFLHAEGFIEKEVEELELERLQETQGLKALRVTVS